MPADTLEDTIVDLRFPVGGRPIPADHGYALYAAVSATAPELHGAKWLGVHPIRGRRALAGTIALMPRSSFALRLPASKIAAALPLAGKTLRLGDAYLIARAPSVEALVPTPVLDARLVVVKLTRVPKRATGTHDVIVMQERALAEMKRQLRKVAATGEITIRGRQSLTVAGKRVIGWSTRIEGLSPEDSLAVQCAGLGGKRRMGCGVFVAGRQRLRPEEAER